jgi:hypothetical protein
MQTLDRAGGFIGTAMFVLAALTWSPAGAQPKFITACTALNFCYCINPDNVSTINNNVGRVRRLISDQKAQGKAIVYLSIPLSTVAGSFYGVNSDVADDTRKRIEHRFGASAIWVLNPGVEGSKPDGSPLFTSATGADYMYMWTQVLESARGLGEDFDLFYFAGPSDFAPTLKLTGTGDLEAVDRYFEARLTSDPHLKAAVDQGKLTKLSFRNYYGIAPSVALSLGSHDEWNIARALNERRRNATELGIARQLPILFDGRPANPADFEMHV